MLEHPSFKFFVPINFFISLVWQNWVRQNWAVFFNHITSLFGALLGAVRKFWQIFTIIIIFGAVSGCENITDLAGHLPSQEEVATLDIGKDTKQSVFEKIGSPAIEQTIDRNAWYYVASIRQNYAYYPTKIIDRKVMEVRFDAQNVLQGVRTFGIEKGKIVRLDPDQTPSPVSPPNILVRLFRNIGALRLNNDEQ